MLSVESKGTVVKRSILQFPPRRQSARKESTIVLSCSEIADTKRRKKTFERKRPQESSPSEWKRQQPCKTYLKGNCTNPSCAHWHPPISLDYKTESGCKFGDMCLFRHAVVEPSKKSKKSGGKGSVALLKNSKQVGCAFQDTEPQKSKYTTSKIGKGTVHRKELLGSVNLKSTEHRKKPLQQERCASREAWDLAKHVHKLHDKDKATFFSSSEGWSLPAPSWKNPEER